MSETWHERRDRIAQGRKVYGDISVRMWHELEAVDMQTPGTDPVHGNLASLKALAQRGLIKPHEPNMSLDHGVRRRDRRSYHVTQAGREALKWRRDAKAQAGTMPPR